MPERDLVYLSPPPSPSLPRPCLLTTDITSSIETVESDNTLMVLSSSNVFPPLSYDASSPSWFSKPLHYSYLPPMMYDVLQWPTLWNKAPLRLDDYEPTKPIQEKEFEATPFRICLRNNNLPAVHRGQVVSYGERNNAERRYIVEHCQLIQNGVAYLKVLCRDKHQKVFPPYHPKFPAFMLLIPASSCFVGYPANLREYENNLNSSTEQDRCYAGGCC